MQQNTEVKSFSNRLRTSLIAVILVTGALPVWAENDMTEDPLDRKDLLGGDAELLPSSIRQEQAAAIRIGVLANRGHEVCMQEWGPTGTYLNERLAPLLFEIIPLDFEEIIPAVRLGELDFVAVNSSYYAYLEHLGLASRKVTLQVPALSGVQSHFGGVILARADRHDIEDLHDLQGKRFAAVSSQSLGGWHAALRELLAAGINPERDFSDRVFLGNHDAVVKAILEAEVDAGTVRSTQIERMEKEGLLDMASIKVIGSRASDFPQYPYALSTRLYPEWPLAALGKTDSELVKRVTVALLQMAEDHEAAVAIRGAGWASPEDYAPVHELLRELRLPPYENYGKLNAKQALWRLWPWLLGLLLLTGLLCGFSVKLVRLNRRQRANEEHLSATLRAIGDGVIACDREGKVTSLNRVAEILTGWSSADAARRPLEEVFRIINVQTRETADNPVARALAEGVSVDLADHTALISKDGREHQIADSCGPIRDASGTVIGAVLVFRDVSEEYRRREELQRISKAVESAGDAIGMANSEGRHFFQNDAFTQMFGYELEEVAKHRPPMMLFADPEDAKAVFDAILAGGSYTKELQVVTKHGNRRDVLLRADSVKDDEGVVVGLVGIFTDITELKQAEVALQKSAEFSRKLISNIGDVIVIIDENGINRYKSENIETFFGWKPDEVVGASALANVHRDDLDAAQAFIMDLLKTPDATGVVECRYRCKDGNYRWIGFTGRNLLHDPDIHGILGNYCDITERKKTEQELLEMNLELKATTARANEMAVKANMANRAKGEFLANMSHEIRTPLNGVIGMTGLLLDTKLTEHQRRYAGIAKSSGESLLGLINDILDFSKIAAGKLDLETLDFDLGSLLEDFASSLALSAHDKGLELVCEADPEVPTLLRGDPGRLRQILSNLAGNALKFTDKGEVAVRVSSVTNDDNEAGGSCLLRFSVRDTGIGIPKDKISLVFQQFTQVDTSTTRKFGGTGLGLAIAKQLAALMGGEVGVESESGKGSEFWFTARFEIQPGATREPAAPPTDLRGVRVLIVDDNATNREILMIRLSSWGMRPEEAKNGPLGLEALHRAVSGGDPFRIAIVDMQMPGMDGETVGRILMADSKISDTRLVMLTSLGARGDAMRLQEIGFAAYATKPVRHEELQYLLSHALNPGVDGALQPIATRHMAREALPDFSHRKGRILLAEDNVINQQVAIGILNKLGISVDAVSNGLEAIKALKARPYDLVLMDVQMPEMDGLEATSQIRNFQSSIPNPSIPIIAITAHTMQGDENWCLNAGMNDYLAKPVSPWSLAKVLKKWLPEEISSQESEVRSQHEETINAIIEPHSSPIWDRSGMMERLMGDEELAGSVLHMFLMDMPCHIEALRAYLDAGDAAGAERKAHTMKGASAYVGAEEIRTLAFQLEQACRAGDLFAVEKQMGDLSAAFYRLREVME